MYKIKRLKGRIRRPQQKEKIFRRNEKTSFDEGREFFSQRYSGICRYSVFFAFFLDMSYLKRYNTPCEICPETTSPGGRTLSCGSFYIQEESLPMKTTFMANAGNTTRKWYIVDAEGLTLGRLAASVAKVLTGKNKPTYTPHFDTGDNVIVINADKVVLTGKKELKKVYFHYTGYIGGDRYQKAGDALREKPVWVVEHAIRGMLPKNKIGDQMYRKLHVYAGSEHPHAAQKPEELKFDIR